MTSLQGWSVTYGVVTDESAEHGDYAETGFHAKNVTFREAMDLWDYDGCHIEADCYPVSYPTWFTAYDSNKGTREWFETDRRECQDLHIPDYVTESSRKRLARLVGCYGV